MGHAIYYLDIEYAHHITGETVVDHLVMIAPVEEVEKTANIWRSLGCKVTYRGRRQSMTIHKLFVTGDMSHTIEAKVGQIVKRRDNAVVQARKGEIVAIDDQMQCMVWVRWEQDTAPILYRNDEIVVVSEPTTEPDLIGAFKLGVSTALRRLREQKDAMWLEHNRLQALHQGYLDRQDYSAAIDCKRQVLSGMLAELQQAISRLECAESIRAL